MPVSESQSRNGQPYEDVLTLEEAAGYLRVPVPDLAELADRNGVPARKVAGEWRFLRKGLDKWLVSRGHDLSDAWLTDPFWLMESPLAEELLLLLEQRLLHKLKQAAPPGLKPGSKQAVLKYYGVFGDDDDLEDRLADARKRREAGG